LFSGGAAPAFKFAFFRFEDLLACEPCNRANQTSSVRQSLSRVLLSLWAQSPCRAQTAAISWQFPLPYQEFYREATSSAAVAPDGTIYQATFQGALFALTRKARKNGKFKAGREIKSSPANCRRWHDLFRLARPELFTPSRQPASSNGLSRPARGWISSPAIGADGTIYFGSWDKNFYALNPDGSQKWVFATSNIVVSSPAIGADGTIYFGSHDKKFYRAEAGRNGSLGLFNRRRDHFFGRHRGRWHDLFHLDGREPACAAS